METIFRTLDIPQNHQITFTLPRSIPIGEEALLKLAGTLKKSANFSGDSLQLQRKMRQEWDG